MIGWRRRQNICEIASVTDHWAPDLCSRVDPLSWSMRTLRIWTGDCPVLVSYCSAGEQVTITAPQYEEPDVRESLMSAPLTCKWTWRLSHALADIVTGWYLHMWQREVARGDEDRPVVRIPDTWKQIPSPCSQHYCVCKSTFSLGLAHFLF